MILANAAGGLACPDCRKGSILKARARGELENSSLFTHKGTEESRDENRSE